jgi:hypothetical protein
MAHAYYPSYLGSRHQEGSWFKDSPGKQLVRPYLKNTQHEKELVEWIKC